MEKSRVLIVGATGYIGRHIANASIDQGHRTHILARPENATNVHKVQALVELRKAGATIHWCSLQERQLLVQILRQVDVVICTVSHEQAKEQYELIDAIKNAGNIKKFYPSEFGTDVDKSKHVFPASIVFDEKIKIRRTIERLGIPHTYISASLFMGYMLASFVQREFKFIPPKDKVCIYSDGNIKVPYTAEADVGTYTIKTVDDPRTINKTVYIRVPENFLTMNEQVHIWEQKIGKTMEKTCISDGELLECIHDPAIPMEIRGNIARVYQFFCRGDLSFELGVDDLEASALYPEVHYTSASTYLDAYV